MGGGGAEFWLSFSLAACLKRTDQCPQHLSQNLRFLQDCGEDVFFRQADPLCEQEVSFHFLERPLANAKKLGVFTTAVPPVGTPTGTAAPQPTPTYTVIVPTQPAPVVTVNPTIPAAPAPSTPAYVWVIIVIGAILVIAVIVLIVRTRRV